MMSQKNSARFCLDTPGHRLIKEEMTFSGWYFPKNEKEPVLMVRVNGEDRTQLRHGISRADVASAFPAEKMAGQSGFSGTFTLSLENTPDTIDIEILDLTDNQVPVSLFKETFSLRPAVAPGKDGSRHFPIPPRDLLERISGDPDPNNFVNSFDSLRFLITSYLADAGLQFSHFDDILDLGCGVGRFLLAFRDSLRHDQRLWGCDVHQGCADWCRDHIDFAEVVHNREEPPLPYRAGQFDLVYALSVFTHLKLDLQFRWTWEVYRALKPGGIAFLTIHGNAFFPTFYRSWRDGLTVSGDTISIGEAGLFAYLAMKSGDNAQGQIGIAAGHSPEFARDLFAPFQILKWAPQSTLAGGQDLYILQKPLHGSPLALPQADESSRWAPREAVSIKSGGKGVRLSFDLDGQSQFRAYPSINLTGSCTMALDIEIQCRTSGKTLVKTTEPFNNNTLFGDAHYSRLTIPVPNHRGPVTVNLCSKATGDHHITSAQQGVVTWGFPHFYTPPQNH